MKTVALDKQRSKCIRKFLYYFPGGFAGKKYKAWEREYKWSAHLLWEERLNKKEYKRLLDMHAFDEIAKRAIGLESKTNLLFSFEKMAVRDAVKVPEGAQHFAEGLYLYVYGKTNMQQRFEAFRVILAHLPRKQTRVLTWPLQTVFGYIADPQQHIFLKPRVTQAAAAKYGFDLKYRSQPNWHTYSNVLQFAEEIRKDTEHLKPVDMIDLQSFIWVLGSEEYPD